MATASQPNRSSEILWADLGGRRSANSRITAPGTAWPRSTMVSSALVIVTRATSGCLAIPSAMSSAPSLFMLHTVSAIGGTLLDSICANCLSILCSSATCFRHNSMPPMASETKAANAAVARVSFRLSVMASLQGFAFGKHACQKVLLPSANIYQGTSKV